MTLRSLLPIKSLFKKLLIRFFYGRQARTVEVVKDGPLVRCRLNDSVDFSVPAMNEFDLSGFSESPEGRAEIQGICKFAKKGGVLFDVGAHIGLISMAFCRSNTNNRAIAFEPSPFLHDTFEKIREINGLSERVFLQKNGIG